MLKYSRKEIKKAWNSEGQGHMDAIERNDSCVVIPCNEEDAINISLWFANKAFAIPTCTHYDGETLSLYYGDAGSGSYNLKSRIESFIDGYFKILK